MLEIASVANLDLTTGLDRLCKIADQGMQAVPALVTLYWKYVQAVNQVNLSSASQPSTISKALLKQDLVVAAEMNATNLLLALCPCQCCLHHKVGRMVAGERHEPALQEARVELGP